METVSGLSFLEILVNYFKNTELNLDSDFLEEHLIKSYCMLNYPMGMDELIKGDRIGGSLGCPN